MKGIDVSKHQGNVNWSHVKADGVKFAIIRAGYGKEAYQKDIQFENNYAGCKSNGIPVGVYWYSYATTPDEARKLQIGTPLIDNAENMKPLSIAVEELYEGKVKIVSNGDDSEIM